LVSRIKQINEIKFAKTMPENLKEFRVVYEVYQNKLELEDYEKIIEKTDEKFIVEATVTNTFALKQRLLELGPNCKIIEPEDIKNRFVQLLKDMKAGYYCD
jgi:predicted DNA-binding transcriptional regulator YafY